jgi:hypothetical protein
MLIKQSSLTLTSSHEQESSVVRTLQVAGQPRAEVSFGKLLDSELHALPIQALQVAVPANTPAQKADADPFQAIMEMLFGLPHVPDGTAATAGGGGGRQPAAVGSLQLVEFTHSSETESCTFSANGNVCLADGSERQFAVGYRMERSEETNTLGAASAFRDPLVVDFGEPGSTLGKNAVEFDLNGDGKTETMRMPGSNSAILFDDRNHNGKADDGSELFGPQSGNGFGELAKLDSDGNGWIDSGDAAYADLKLWQVTDDGASRVQSLAAAGIGALATQNADTQFTLKENGASVGQMRASSVWLGENSGAGLVRQIDLATTPHETQAT